MHLSALLALAAASVSGFAQAPPITAPGASIAVRIAMEKDQVPLGQSPVVVLTIWNTSDHVVMWTGDSWRLHVESKSGEPPKTMWYRQFLREPGLPALEVTLPSFTRPIYPPGLADNLIDEEFTLSDYYDLLSSGSYSAYLEVGDDSGKMLKTNTIQFEILPLKQ
jgi:hypothetical protein